jgi:hypothetical protein
VTKTWEQLAKEAGGDSDFAKKLDGIPGKERASMGGPVEAGTTYESWFAEQDRERQLEILGPGRMGMYERGTLGFSDMVNMAGKPMTLGELEAKIEQMAFQVDRARLEEWFKKPDKQIVVDDFIVDNLPHYIQELLKTSAESMRIGHDYLDIPSHKKRNVPPETFARLINKMPDCKEVYDRGPLNIGLIIEDDHRWVIILKTTKNHAEVFLTSLRRINDSKLNRWRTSGNRVY